MEKGNKLTVFDNVRLWWKYEARHYYRDFIQGVKNLWKWFPVVWKDRDWDQSFIYDVINFKLNKQADYIGGRNVHTRAKRDAETMKLVARLIKLEKDDFYDMEYIDYFVQKVNWLEVEGKPHLKRYDTEIITENFDDYFKKYPRQYKKALSGELNRYNRPVEQKNNQLIAMEIAHENQNRCRKLIFKIMEQNISRWWD